MKGDAPGFYPVAVHHFYLLYDLDLRGADWQGLFLFSRPHARENSLHHYPRTFYATAWPCAQSTSRSDHAGFGAGAVRVIGTHIGAANFLSNYLRVSKFLIWGFPIFFQIFWGLPFFYRSPELKFIFSKFFDVFQIFPNFLTFSKFSQIFWRFQNLWRFWRKIWKTSNQKFWNPQIIS